jgi:hypothetical protein
VKNSVHRLLNTTVNYKLPALTLPTIQTSHTPVHHHHRLGAAFGAERGFFGEGLAFGGSVQGFEFAAFLVEQLFLVVGHRFRLDHADVLQVRFDRVADFGDQRRHEHTAFLEIAAARVEHRFQFLDQEDGVAAFPEHRRNNPRQRQHPLEVLHVLRVDEDFVRTAFFMLGALVQDDVVDRDVQRVLGLRGFDLVGGADQDFRAFDVFVHAFEVAQFCFDRGLFGGGLVFLGQHLVGDDFL